MGNQNTAQKSIERNCEQSQNITSTYFESLKDMPVSLSKSQCVLHKHEILICGGWNKRECYSYHLLKDEYKFICKYPRDVIVAGHCIVKLVDNNNEDSNQITLLSFGGYVRSKKHTLVMKYISVWSNDSNGKEINKSKNSKKLKDSSDYNKWVPFTNNDNNPIIIGRNTDHYNGARAVIGGSNSHLLFITYHPWNISVFDLNTFQFIKHNDLPAKNEIWYHCFVSKSAKKNEENKSKRNKNDEEMLLFCEQTGLSIRYDEDNNTFQFYQLPVCDDITAFRQYAYVCTNDSILLFGGYGWKNGECAVSTAAHKYFIQERRWITFNNAFSIPLHNCVGLLNEDNNNIHVIGGNNNSNIAVAVHIKTKTSVWIDSSQLVVFILIFQNYLILFFFL
ncbi:hypothetical protein RFI_28459 [Reticulomyxa filosa]|uniref:Kelch motif family protein n=1 Tax=Reticulomyxa filosa TaxID=46433 RepID=X6M4M6_RETFI|nr:hypothetical protein RFI_28459 [Reticulomyxa filosa]|eukprot:ETO08928.1 hypothetical protein RFI_28459 [Reticulomyxa filosa]